MQNLKISIQRREHREFYIRKKDNLYRKLFVHSCSGAAGFSDLVQTIFAWRHFIKKINELAVLSFSLQTHQEICLYCTHTPTKLDLNIKFLSPLEGAFAFISISFYHSLLYPTILQSNPCQSFIAPDRVVQIFDFVASDLDQNAYFVKEVMELEVVR